MEHDKDCPAYWLGVAEGIAGIVKIQLREGMPDKVIQDLRKRMDDIMICTQRAMETMLEEAHHGNN